ncbi:MAG: M42 family metallopeptidase [Ignavibacteriales bacterium]
MAQVAEQGVFEFLGRLSALVGLPGHEAGVSAAVSEAFGALCDEVKLDRLGNCIALKRGDGEGTRPKVMFAAHMDEIGLIVTRIEEGGFLRFTNLGGVDPRILPGSEVVVHGRDCLPGIVGVKPPHILRPEEFSEAAKMEDMYIDCGLPGAVIRERVNAGDVVSLSSGFSKLGDLACGKSMDDRAGVAVLYDCLGRLKHMRHVADVYAVATVQEEAGLRGAMVSTFGVTPDVGIAIDVTHGDMAGVPEYETSRLEKGPAISAGPNVHPRVFSRLQEVAREHSVPFQVEVSPASTGTDAWAMQIVRSGVATGVISVPTRYMHTPVETVAVEDIKQAGRLAAHFAAAVDRSFVEGLKCF